VSARSAEVDEHTAWATSAPKQCRGARLGVPVDLVVVPASHVDGWGHFEGTMLNDALREGRVLFPA
jgi:hypothetical protein